MGHSEQPPLDLALARLAGRQHGIASLEQLVGLGFSVRAVYGRVRAGRLHRVRRGVYAVGHRRLTTKGRWLAAVLSCGPTAVLSHRQALALWSLRAVPAGPIDVTVPSNGRRSPPGIRLHRARALHPHDTTTLDAIPVTSVARTLLDYSPTASPQELRTTLEAAERLELFDGRAIQELLERSPGRATARLKDALNALTDDVPWTASQLERHFLELVREAGLPEPQVNMSVKGHAADFHWSPQRLVVEVDGWLWHRTRAQFEEDRRRDAQRAVNGITTVRLTQRRMQRERARVQRELRALLSNPNLL